MTMKKFRAKQSKQLRHFLRAGGVKLSLPESANLLRATKGSLCNALFRLMPTVSELRHESHVRCPHSGTTWEEFKCGSETLMF